MKELANLICLQYMWQKYPRRVWLQSGGLSEIPEGLTREQFLVNNIIGKWIRGWDAIGFEK